MATQTFVSDMQAINATPVQQVQQQTPSSQPPVSQSQTPTLAIQKVVTTQGIQLQSAAQQQQQQQFIVTISGEHGSEQGTGETVQLQQVQQGSGQATVYPTHVQQAYTEYSQPAMYSTQYYQTTQGGTSMPAGIAQVGGIQHQILTQQGGTYLVQGGAMDGEGTPLTHTTRASPATETTQQKTVNFDTKCWQREFLTKEDPDMLIPGFSTSKTHKAVTDISYGAAGDRSYLANPEVQWLIDNYETAEGVSLPRSTLYSHYLRHCQEQKMDPMNPASFGKLIRSVFLGLRTRRLGTRGNSKYHYYGIRIKAMSPLNQFTDEQTMALRQQPMSQGKSFARFKQGMAKGDGTDGENSNSAQSDGPYTQHQKHQQFLGDASGAIPNFGTIETGTVALPDGIDQENIRDFENLYKEHCEAILDVVVNLQFSLIEALWQSFWRNSPADQQDGDCESEAMLPKDKLYAMGKIEAVQEYVKRSDFSFYQALVEVLIPDVLRPIPSSLTQAIRNFAKSLEGWLKGAMTGVPDEMVKTKVSAVSAFAQTLRRYTSLNHLAQAARAVLQNTSQINQMLTDLNRVDFVNVQEQASWVCQCDDSVVHQLEQDFKKTLQQQNSLEQWAEWLEEVVSTVLKPHEGSPNFPKAARQFLLKWSFYSSMVIRDLTLRSAASFGSFHLIRLLYDEFMFYLVEHKVASSTGETPIAVMGEVRQFMDLSGVMAIGTLESESAKTTAPPTIKVNTAPVGNAVPNGTVANTQTIVLPSGQQSQLSNGTATISGSTPVVINTGNLHTSSSTPTTVTVLATGTPAHGHGTKTIVVVPVSAAGDANPRPAKIAKTS